MGDEPVAMAVDEPALPAGGQHPAVVALIGARFGFSQICPRARPGPRSRRVARRGFARRLPSASLHPSPRDTPARSRVGDPPCRLIIAAVERLLTPPNEANAAIGALLVLAPTIASSSAGLATDDHAPPTSIPLLSPLAAKYRVELDDKLSRLAELQAQYETEGEVALRTRHKPARAGAGAAAADDSLGAPDAPPARLPRQPWQKHERERVRRALLQFGLGRWDKIRASLRPPSLEKRDVDDCVLASWDFVRAVAERCAGREARYLVGRLRAAPKIEHHPDPLVGPWSKVPQNASQWARRLRLLDDVNRAAERCLAEETQDEALAMFATMPDPKLPPWWNPDCDLFLLHGAREHGFGKYDETLRDATCRPGFERAARDAGPDAEAALRASVRKSEEAAEVAKDATIGGTAKHAPGCGCFACKAARRMSLTSADEGDDGEGEGDDAADDAAAAAAKQKQKDEIEDEKAAADAEMADANGDDEDEDVNDEDDMDEEDDMDADDGEEDGASIRSEATDGDLASRAAAVSAAAERAAEARKAKLAAKRREARARARAAEESADPNAWPTSETLTNRLRALAKTIGAPEALAPSDPPWVAAALGRPRVRPRRRDPFGFGSAAANDPARRERKRAKREARNRAESRAANAMASLDWEALGGHPPAEGADGAGATGDETEEEEMRACERRFEAAKRRTANFTKRDKNRIVKAAMGHGLPTRSDGNPDWNALARLAEVRGKSEEEIRDGFETIALEMGLLTRATKGKATRHREPAHLHKSTCKCIVCRIKRQKAEASADADSAAPTPGGSPEPDRSGDAPGGNTPERDEEEDSDDDDDAFIMRQASGADADGDGDGDGDGDDEETPGKKREGGDGDGDGEPGAKRKNKGNKPHGLLSVITADRLRKRLDMMQNLRMATSFAGGASRLPLPVITTKELPEWWSGAPHVVALVEGALRHGCEDWDAVASDPKLPFAARAAEAGEPDSARLPIPRMCVHVLLIVSRFLRRGPLKKWIAEEKARAKARGR